MWGPGRKQSKAGFTATAVPPTVPGVQAMSAAANAAASIAGVLIKTVSERDSKDHTKGRSTRP